MTELRLKVEEDTDFEEWVKKNIEKLSEFNDSLEPEFVAFGTVITHTEIIDGELVIKRIPLSEVMISEDSIILGNSSIKSNGNSKP